MKASYKKYILDFKRPGSTSRGVMKKKETWFLALQEKGQIGIGECGLLRKLSIDDVPDYDEMLKWTCNNIHLGREVLWETLKDFPSIQFGIEQAFLSLHASRPFELFPSEFTRKGKHIRINGLIWMGDHRFMHDQIRQKLSDGFKCIKLKIGAIDFNQEISLISFLRKKYSKEELEIRVDANGAFTIEDALKRLEKLSEFELHSIEQPIRPGNHSEMRRLCDLTPLPIALDEELIGISEMAKKEALLQTISPQYIILKPSLVGGFQGCKEWISLAKKYDIGWWITSALESNIGLNAIAQWTYTLKCKMPQGLGTGGLFNNNIESPLTVKNGNLYYDSSNKWNTDQIRELCI